MFYALTYNYIYISQYRQLTQAINAGHGQFFVSSMFTMLAKCGAATTSNIKTMRQNRRLQAKFKILLNASAGKMQTQFKHAKQKFQCLSYMPFRR